MPFDPDIIILEYKSTKEEQDEEIFVTSYYAGNI